jgi:hypothetical protein
MDGPGTVGKGSVMKWFVSLGIAVILASWISGMAAGPDIYSWPHYVGFVVGVILFAVGLVAVAKENQQHK